MSRSTTFGSSRPVAAPSARKPRGWYMLAAFGVSAVMWAGIVRATGTLL
ncbi:hypothetical protein [Chthonobacter rhizosphaerae]|nr:hypothetical protein [Chthonobacter rhizosphaerae]